jgi:hypothetical protein
MHFTEMPRREVRWRALVAALAAFLLLLAAVAPAFAAEPIDARDRDAGPRRVYVAPPKQPTSRPLPTPVATPTPTSTPEPKLGFDVSWPQCNDEHPEHIGFAIVGVDGGRVYKPNPCLVEQLEWAGEGGDLYINTANPGPRHSQFWPSGSAEPRACDTDARPGTETADCAYVYGWNAAADSYRRALEAYVSLGWVEDDADRLPDEITWWLDVETANSWMRDRGLNVASLHGAVDYLDSMGAEDIGFYSTPLLWWRITAGTDDFEAYPAWHAGGHSEEEAAERCDHDAFTGGTLRFVQWIEDGIDRNLRCS